MRRFLWVFLVLFFSCGEDEPDADVIIDDLVTDFVVELPEENLIEAMDSTADFLTFYRKFLAAFLDGTEAELDQYFHPEFGIHIIHSFSGAIPQISQFDKSAHFYHNEDIRKAIEALSEEVTLEPLFESLPEVICDDEVYSKTGCFAEYTKNDLSDHPWNMENKFESLINTIEITVINTYLAVFYFSKIEGKWYLTFLDLRVPCQA